MKMRLLLAFTALAIGFAVPVLAQEKNTIDPAVRQQIEAVNMKYDEAYNKGDAAAIVARYTQDAVEVLGWASGGVASGWQAIEERYKIRFAATASTPDTLSRKLVQVYAIGNDICAISEFSHVYRQGSKGYSVTIYVREGDDWKIRMAYAN
jgi:ketosteroid isomerase-like protein